MPLVCIQCAMKAMLAGTPPPVFEQPNDEHMAMYHPDPLATQAERTELERALTEKLKGEKP